MNSFSAPTDVVVCAAGSIPGDLHKLWRTRDLKGYHVEYDYSCMGYEIAGGLGVQMAAPDREVYVMVGDDSYLMLSSEIVTAVPSLEREPFGRTKPGSGREDHHRPVAGREIRGDRLKLGPRLERGALSRRPVVDADLAGLTSIIAEHARRLSHPPSSFRHRTSL